MIDNENQEIQNTPKISGLNSILDLNSNTKKFITNNMIKDKKIVQ